jgi:UDP-N-acetylglucosamine 2-epimerase (non-hydrolysing)
MKRVLSIFGTRPEAVKMAPVVRALQQSADFESVVAVTAQHRSMLDQVRQLFDITPDVDLDIIQPRQTLAGITARALQGLDPAIAELAPDAIAVQGDTTTTFVGALAGFYHQVPVFHLEAGLRTFERYSPYPEELNRRLTTQLASLHLAPTATSRDNLLREGVDPATVVVTGNTVIDALLDVVDRHDGYGDPALDDLDVDGRRVLLVTAHRRESWGEPMLSIGRAIATLAKANPDLLVVFPIHRNPVVREAIVPAVDGLDNVRVIEPLDYGGFSRLLQRAHVILSDSGGVQEEGPSLGKPVLVLRESTERPEAVEAGTVRLVGTDTDAVVDAVQELLDDEGAYRRMAAAVNPYGDGHAASRSVAAMAHFFGLGPRAEEFDPARPLDRPARVS